MSEEIESKLEQPVSRRDFLTIALSITGGVVAVELGAIGLAYFSPRQGEGEFGSTITAGLVDDFPPGSVTPITEGRFYLTRLEDGGFMALYQRCTHLGCTVPWDQAKQKFVCPCHSAEYGRTGEVLAAPAPRPMDLFPVTIDSDGLVQVDTGQTISRDHFDTGQVVYA